MSPLHDNDTMPLLPFAAQTAASSLSTFDLIVERFLLALIGVFAGGTFVNWKVGRRIVKVEHALWGTDTNNGLSSRVKKVEETLGVVVSNQERHTLLLSHVAESVGEIRDTVRTIKEKP